MSVAAVVLGSAVFIGIGAAGQGSVSGRAWGSAIVLVIAAIGIAFLPDSVRLVLDAVDGRCGSVEGAVHRWIRRTSRSEVCKLTIGGHAFSVPRAVYDDVGHGGGPFRIYHAPRSRAFASIERLRRPAVSTSSEPLI